MKTIKELNMNELCNWLNSQNETKLFQVINGELHTKLNPDSDKQQKVVNLEHYLNSYKQYQEIYGK